MLLKWSFNLVNSDGQHLSKPVQINLSTSIRTSFWLHANGWKKSRHAKHLLLLLVTWSSVSADWTKCFNLRQVRICSGKIKLVEQSTRVLRLFTYGCQMVVTSLRAFKQQHSAVHLFLVEESEEAEMFCMGVIAWDYVTRRFLSSQQMHSKCILNCECARVSVCVLTDECASGFSAWLSWR